MAQNRTQIPSKKGGFRSPQKRAREDRESQLSLEEADNRFYDIFSRHGFASFPHEKRRTLVRFYKMLLDEQNRHNSTRLHTIKEVAVKHFIDSLIVADLTKLTFPLLDVGTGAGFPGVPLKVIYPEERIILAEGVQKRVEFLKTVRQELNFKNLDIIGKKIASDFEYPVMGVITRAFADLGETLDAVQHSLKKDGKIFFMKGPGVDPEIEAAKKNWGHLYQLEQNVAYELPNTPHQRRLVVFRKVAMPPPPDLDAQLNREWAQDEKYDPYTGN